LRTWQAEERAVDVAGRVRNPDEGEVLDGSTRAAWIVVRRDEGMRAGAAEGVDEPVLAGHE
jgi:hypothetical protein